MNVWNKIADLEKNDPEIARLSDRVRDAVDSGGTTEGAANRAFNAAVGKRLGIDLNNDR